MNSSIFCTPIKSSNYTTQKLANFSQQSTNTKTNSKIKINLKSNQHSFHQQINTNSMQNISQTFINDKLVNKSLIKRKLDNSQKQLQKVKKRLFVEKTYFPKAQLKHKRGIKLVLKEKQAYSSNKKNQCIQKNSQNTKLYKIKISQPDSFFCIFMHDLQKLNIQRSEISVYNMGVLLKQNGLILDLVQDRCIVNQIYHKIQQIKSKYNDNKQYLQQKQIENKQIEAFYAYSCLISLLNYPIMELDYAYKCLKYFANNSENKNITKVVGVQIYRNFKQKQYKNIKLNHFLKGLNR